MKIKVTFEDILDVEVEEQAYDEVLKHCSEIVETGDLTSFNFEEVKEEDLMHRAKTLVIKTSGEILSRLMDDYSDIGYMNANGGDIIIDLTYIEDDAEQLAHFFEVTGLTKADIEGLDYMGFYS